MKFEDSLSFDKNIKLFSRYHPETVETAQIWHVTFQQGMANQAGIYLDWFIYQSHMYIIW
jgi:hypothetical protein